jgi:hypothetical protein
MHLKDPKFPKTGTCEKPTIRIIFQGGKDVDDRCCCYKPKDVVCPKCLEGKRKCLAIQKFKNSSA